MIRARFAKFAHIECPYCKTDNPVMIDTTEPEWNPQIITCNNEIGGCDKSFAVAVRLEPNYTTYELHEHYPTNEDIKLEQR